MAADETNEESGFPKHGWWQGVLRSRSSRSLSDSFRSNSDNHIEDEDTFYDCEEGDLDVACTEQTSHSWTIAGLSAIRGIGALLLPWRAKDQECWEEEDAWLVFPGCRVTSGREGEDDEVDAMPCTELVVCKHVCEARGYGGFVLEQGVAFFHTRQRSDLLVARVRVVPIEDATAETGAPMLYLAPDSNTCSAEANLRQEWVEVMEANLALLRELRNERQRAQAEALTAGDVAGAEASARDLRRVESQQAFLESALWHMGAEAAIGKDDVKTPNPLLSVPELSSSCPQAEPEHKVQGYSSQPPDSIKGKGKPKGAQTLPPPLGKGKGIRKGQAAEKMPLGRRFHWQALQADQLRGTVFDDPSSKSPSQFKELTALFRVKDGEFQEDTAQREQGQGSPTALDNQAPGGRQAGVLSRARVQHIGIVLYRVLGLTAKVEDAELLARGVEAMELPLPGMPTHYLDEAERLDLLATAIPTPAEAADLQSADSKTLRPVERLVLPLSRVARAAARLRALRLAVQAREHQKALQNRIHVLVSASQALRSSDALRKLLLAVAHLGSWINSADPNAHRGFALSSALGKLRQFRAPNGKRDVTLLHVALLAAADGDAKAAGTLGEQLAEELKDLSEVTREQVADLAQEVRDFGADASWVAAEAKRSEGPDGGYTDEAKARLQAIHDEELVQRAEELTGIWSAAQGELESMLVFFAERWDNERGFEHAVNQIFHTVESFKSELCRAARQVVQHPRRYLPANSTTGSSSTAPA